MFVILSYDVNKKRVGKALKTCRKYLHHHHKSVFEGDLTEAELTRLMRDLDKILKPEEDAVCIYRFEYRNQVTKIEIGPTEERTNII